MTSRTYLRLSTVLPLLPMPFLLLGGYGWIRRGTLFEPLAFLGWAGWIMIPVYVPLIAVTLMVLRRSSSGAHGLAALTMPLLAAVGWSLMNLSGFRDQTTMLVVIVGYAYVLVVLVGLWIGQRLRLLTRS